MSHWVSLRLSARESPSARQVASFSLRISKRLAGAPPHGRNSPPALPTPALALLEPLEVDGLLALPVRCFAESRLSFHLGKLHPVFPYLTFPSLLFPFPNN